MEAGVSTAAPDMPTNTQVAPANPEPDPAMSALDEAEPEAATNSSPKKKPWMLVIGVLAAIGIIVGIAVTVISSNRAQAYEEAQAYYHEGKYAEAKEVFDELGDYEDSAAWSQKAELWLQAQAEESSAGDDPTAWERAASRYLSINEPQAATAAEDCLDAASYYTAKGLMAEGNWEEARDLFSDLEDKGYQDAGSLKMECSYNIAKGLMAEGNWEEARDLFSDLEDKGYQDAGSLKMECSAHITFEEAEALYAEGYYYDAYVKYSSISSASYEGLPDMHEKAQACIQSFPEAGVVYRNGDYPDQNCELSIDNSANTNAYYKLYMGDTLIATVFIPEGGYTTFSLPAGTYRMTKGYGSTWFGTTDMFGDEGVYWACTFGTSEEVTLEAWSGYEISSGGDGTPISNHSSNRKSI